MAKFDAGDRFLRRYPVLAVALLVFLLGTMPGIVRNADLWRALQPSGGSADVPHYAKREPLRALAAIERKDSQSSGHWLGADGILPPQLASQGHPDQTAGASAVADSESGAFRFWPSRLPRAPPHAA
jgi:hypothetical protein